MAIRMPGKYHSDSMNSIIGSCFLLLFRPDSVFKEVEDDEKAMI